MIDQYPPFTTIVSTPAVTSLIWRKTAAGGETSLSGYDDSSQALAYTPGEEQVYLNGILLVRGLDYTATNGTSITGLSALAENDYVQINCYNEFSISTFPAASITGTISNAQLANSSITINGSEVSLGGSVSGLATLSNPTFTGTVSLPSGTSLISPNITGTAKIQQILEKVTVSETSANNTINYDLITNGGILYYTSNASGNWTLNIRGNSTTSLNSIMSIGESLTIAFLITNGGTAYYQTGFQIDENSVTPKWQGGSAPSSGNTNSIDIYTFTIIKTADQVFTVLEDVARFA